KRLRSEVFIPRERLTCPAIFVFSRPADHDARFNGRSRLTFPSPPMNDLPPPVALALIVAETVTVDPRTKRLTAHGIFHSIDQCPVRLDFSLLAFVTEVTRPV